MSEESQSDGRAADGRFVKGHPGGPGRPRKIVAAAANALDARGAAKAGDLFEIAFRQADEGNTTALKMLLDRVWPVGRGRPLGIAMPEAPTVIDMLAASTAVANAVLAGEASVQEGTAIAELLKAHEEVVERHDVVQDLAQKLEARARKREEAKSQGTEK